MFLGLGNMLRAFKLVLTLHGINVMCSLVIIISQCNAQILKAITCKQNQEFAFRTEYGNCCVDWEMGISRSAQ